MATIQEINVWEKGTNKQTGMLDFQVKISMGDMHTVSEAIDAINEISFALKKGVK